MAIKDIKLSERLGEYLIKRGKLTKEQVSSALERQVIMGGRLGTNLIELGLINEDDLTELLSKKLNIPYASSEEIEDIDQNVIDLIPSELVERYNVIPLKKEKNTLFLAMLDPLNFDIINEIGFITNCAIKPFISTEARILYALEKYYNISRKLRYISLLEEEKKKAKAKEKEKEKKAILKGREFDIYLKMVKEDLVKVNDREEVIRIILKNMSYVLDRVIFFVVKKDILIGWAADSPDLNIERIKQLQFSLEEPSIFKDIIERRSHYKGSLYSHPINQRLIKSLGGEFPSEIYSVPLFVKDQIVAIIYGDNFQTNKMISNLDFLNILAHKGSLGLEVILLKKKILE